MTFSRPSRPARPMDPARALVRLEELCARSEQCEGELREKLRKWSIPSNKASEIIASLRSRRFVDDARFARAYVRDKFRFSHWGRRKIEMYLRQKRVEQDIIDVALDEIDPEDYLLLLRRLLSAKAATLRDDPGSFEARNKLYRFAIGRGFEPSVISQALSSQ